MELTEEIRAKSSSWLIDWAQSQRGYHDYMPYALAELVERAKQSPDIVARLVEVIEIQTEFLDPRKPMPSSIALQKVFQEGPESLRNEIVKRADNWPERKQEDLIMFGLQKESRDAEVASWTQQLGFTRKKVVNRSV
ncbi:hypothetical protein So717_36990 [Roseobacter cerasinus]|uniref:Uncharacterized protein n=1 Tax=Roseobacter cerasinus TaxID=2602289 RepID=A0A640W0F8_9RHOB|nr:hypothetical protein [Roseobacter cerasinus]GFE51946.1 hypothetical protein So717_36990 [Roseobacter cerasinus]